MTVEFSLYRSHKCSSSTSADASAPQHSILPGHSYIFGHHCRLWGSP